MWGMIATWRMALEGITHASTLLAKGEKSAKAVVNAVADVEDFHFINPWATVVCPAKTVKLN